MCIDLDLFGQVIVTISDVELWLENSRLSPDNTPNRIKGYIKDYDIASKIRAAKLSGEFYNLQPATYGYDHDMIREAFISYKKPVETTATGCPLTWHRCTNPACPVYQKNKRRDYNRKKYEEKKAQRESWLESCKLMAA